MVDITILGEVSLDTLHSYSLFTRPGGIIYSALAGRCVGATVSVMGYMGIEGNKWVKSILKGKGVNLSQFRRKNRPTNRFSLHHVDEVEPTSVERQDSGVPDQATPFPGFHTKALLLYSYPPKIIHDAIDACPEAVISFDLQYDLGSREEIAGILRRCKIVFVSRNQGLEYFGVESVTELATAVRQFGPSIVIVKSGLCGSTIYHDEGMIEIPRFEANWQQSVGAGDVYNAVFLAVWLQSSDLVAAGCQASAAAARYCESNGDSLLDERWDLSADLSRPSFYLHPDELKSSQVYLAGPFFNCGQDDQISRTVEMLESHGVSVYSPRDEDGQVDLSNPIECRATYSNNLSGLDRSSALVALLDDNDPGTIFEIGYAVKKGIPVIGLWTGRPFTLNLMLSEGTRVVSTYRELISTLLEEVQLLR